MRVLTPKERPYLFEEDKRRNVPIINLKVRAPTIIFLNLSLDLNLRIANIARKMGMKSLNVVVFGIRKIETKVKIKSWSSVRYCK